LSLLALLPLPALLVLPELPADEKQAPPDKEPQKLLVKAGAEHYRILHVEFKNNLSCDDVCTKLRKDHKGAAHVICQFKQFVDVFVSTTAAGTFDAAGEKAFAVLTDKKNGYFWHDEGDIIKVPEPPATVPEGGKRGEPDPIITGGCEGLTGKGVIVAILDLGIDFHNPDFIAPDGKTSRLLYYWDTVAEPRKPDALGKDAPVTYPNNVSIGVVYDRETLTEAIRKNDRRSITTEKVARKVTRDRTVWFDGGHGTACMTVAAGNGRKKIEGKYVGVAPEADLIAVRLGELGNMDNAYLINAICEWLEGVAKKHDRRLVVSCSYGGRHGGHDGNAVLERHLSERWPDSAQGRALCISAGNEGYQPVHVEQKLEPGRAAELTWKAPDGGWLELFFDTKDKDAVEFDGPSALLKQRLKRSLKLHEPSGQVRGEASVDAGEGTLSVTLKPARKQAVILDAYILGYDPDSALNSVFLKPHPLFTKLVGRPGTTPNAITVGSYDWNPVFKGKDQQVKVGRGMDDWRDMRVKALSAYSSPGPSRTTDKGVIKPDLVAPGQWYTVNFPASSLEGSPTLRAFNGTSAATPYTAGVIALMFDDRAGPKLTLGEVRKKLAACCIDDDDVQLDGKVPSPKWGRGKLAYTPLCEMLKGLKPGKGKPTEKE
jgi:subtilisin family serine protease